MGKDRTIEALERLREWCQGEPSRGCSITVWAPWRLTFVVSASQYPRFTATTRDNDLADAIEEVLAQASPWPGE